MERSYGARAGTEVYIKMTQLLDRAAHLAEFPIC